MTSKKSLKLVPLLSLPDLVSRGCPNCKSECLAMVPLSGCTKPGVVEHRIYPVCTDCGWNSLGVPVDIAEAGANQVFAREVYRHAVESGLVPLLDRY